ncbi:hypothetical protein G7Y89_g15748 [Cudoniella acicularis]|uniref:Protein kinase domain-containing protein n=1 Tax=Cudoniella acicularis TaxID=354080 RepID=A0A8H4QHA4_9HELO|nr:hypothetical protein G7Y89_g15748 [Cudoniella acicularis]
MYSRKTWLDRRRQWMQGPISPAAAASSSSSRTPSSQLSVLRQESGGSHIAILNRLLNTLKENEVPGPQLFRLRQEFSEPLGEGGEGNVRAIDRECAARYRKMGKNMRERWPVELIAIKQYQSRREWTTGGQKLKLGYTTSAGLDDSDLGSRFRAAECEILALSPSLFRENPNIVQLLGWGLCLDTLEDAQSSCCRGVQVPLLVLERADMNFLQFLRQLFPDNQRLDASAATSRRLEHGTQTSGFANAIQGLGRTVLQWTGIEVDSYETIRLLCMDIGHGLQSLHEHDFTHGDLKPTNVLIFRTPTRWLAKLCDFGCAFGKPTNVISAAGTPGTPTCRQRYLGTPDWQRRRDEASDEHDYDGLQNCDLYVYGLLVWSAFCLRGEPPPSKTWEAARADLGELERRARWSTAENKRWISHRVGKLLDSAMASPLARSRRPWVHLLG